MMIVFWILAAAAAAGVGVLVWSIATGRYPGSDRWAPLAGLASLAALLIINAVLNSMPDSTFGYRAGHSRMSELIYTTVVGSVFVSPFAGLLFVVPALRRPVGRRISAVVFLLPISAMIGSLVWSLILLI